MTFFWLMYCTVPSGEEARHLHRNVIGAGTRDFNSQMYARLRFKPPKEQFLSNKQMESPLILLPKTLLRNSLPQTCCSECYVGTRFVILPTLVAVRPSASNGQPTLENGMPLETFRDMRNANLTSERGPFRAYEPTEVGEPWPLTFSLRGLSPLSEAIMGLRDFEAPDVSTELAIRFGPDRDLAWQHIAVIIPEYTSTVATKKKKKLES